MSILAIFAALLLEQWQPLAERKSYADVLEWWTGRLERFLKADATGQGVIAWSIGVVVPVAVAYAVYAALLSLSPFLALLFNVAALYLTLGFRQFSRAFTRIDDALKAGELESAREQLGALRSESAQHRSREEVIRLAIEDALAASHQHVFGVLFWFVLLPGPCGAIAYRLAHYLRRRWSGLGAFGHFAERAFYVLEWPAVRLTAASFAIVGDFEDAVYCWRTQARGWDDPNLGVVLATGAGALGVRLGMPLGDVDGIELRPELGIGRKADGRSLDAAVALLWRALAVWLIVLVLLSATRLIT